MTGLHGWVTVGVTGKSDIHFLDLFRLKIDGEKRLKQTDKTVAAKTKLKI